MGAAESSSLLLLSDNASLPITGSSPPCADKALGFNSIAAFPSYKLKMRCLFAHVAGDIASQLIADSFESIDITDSFLVNCLLPEAYDGLLGMLSEDNGS